MSHAGCSHGSSASLDHRGSGGRPSHVPHAAPAPTFLAITAWSLAHSTALTERIELVEAGSPVSTGAPNIFPRTASRDRH
jgi:hypothetical protein